MLRGRFLSVATNAFVTGDALCEVCVVIAFLAMDCVVPQTVGLVQAGLLDAGVLDRPVATETDEVVNSHIFKCNVLSSFEQLFQRNDDFGIWVGHRNPLLRVLLEKSKILTYSQYYIIL